jgi:hypothetical protein
MQSEKSNLFYSATLGAALLIGLATQASAQKKYDPGASDTDIKVAMPYSGPASAYATIGKTEAAYLNKLNSEGGINGRNMKLALEFTQRLAAIRSPVEFFSVIAEFTTKRITLLGKHSIEMVELSTKRVA